MRPNEKWRQRAPYFLIVLLVASGLTLRWWALRHGIGLHNDESSIIDGSLKLSWKDLSPKSYFYGSLTYYLPWLAAQLISPFGYWPSNFDEWVIIGRFLAILAGGLSVLLTYFLGQTLFPASRFAPIGGAFLVTFNILHIQLSRFYTSDILLTATSQCVLLASILFVSTGSFGWAMVGSVAIGVSLALKVTAASLLAPLGCAFLVVLLRKRQFFTVVVWGIFSLLVVISVALLLQPYLIAQSARFLDELNNQMEMVNGLWRAPWNNQYYGTPAYWYPFQQMLLYTFGVPVFLLLPFGIARASLQVIRERRFEHLVVFAWLIPFIGVVGGYQVKFLRYFLPIYPFLLLYIAFGAEWLSDMFARRSRKLSSGFLIALYSWVCVGGVAFAGIYLKPHIHREASEWICQNLPQGSRILQVPWDTQLPRCGHLTRFPTYLMEPPEWELPFFEEGHDERFEQKFFEKLSKGDYLVFPSQRVLRGVLQVSFEYPITARAIRMLFAGELGYELAKTVERRHSLGPYSFSDAGADESLSVHDHPKSYLLQNRHRFTSEELSRKVHERQSDDGLPSLETILLMEREE